MSVLVAIPVHERAATVRLCLPTVAEMLLPKGSEIVLFDDASKTFDVAALATEIGLTAKIERPGFRLGADAMIYYVWSHFLASPHTELLFLDSDLIVNPRALLDGLDALAEFPGLLSLYNSQRHPALSEAKPLVLKPTLGNAGTLWRRDLVQLVKTALAAGQYIDDRYSRFLGANDIPLAATKASLVQHLGIIGTNNSHLGDFDHGLNFVPDTPRQLQAIAAIYDEIMLNQLSYLPPLPRGDAVKS